MSTASDEVMSAKQAWENGFKIVSCACFLFSWGEGFLPSPLGEPFSRNSTA